MAGITELQDTTGFRTMKALSPFQTYANSYIPVDRTRQLDLSFDMFRFNGQIAQIITKMAQFPLTETTFSIDDADLLKGNAAFNSKEKAQEYYRDLYIKKLDIATFLEACNVDFATYTTALPYVWFDTQIRLTCPHCSKKGDSEEGNQGVLLKDLPEEAWKYDASKVAFTGKCPVCHKEVEFTAEEEVLQNDEHISLLRFDPRCVRVKEASFTRKRRYIYTPPTELVSKIKRGDKHEIANSPMIILKAVAKNQSIELDSSFFCHMTDIEPTSTGNPWPIPRVIRAWAAVFYLATLRKAAEAIALQHIKPMIVLFPNVPPNTGLATAVASDYSSFGALLRDEYKAFLYNQGHMMISPVPVGYQFIGGDARMLLPTSETQVASQELYLSYGIPLGVFTGEMAYSGAMPMMRIIENQFGVLRRKDIAVLNFIQSVISRHLMVAKMRIGMKPFRMTDDVLYKQMCVQMFQLGILSEEFICEMQGIDYAIERDRKKNEIEAKEEMNRLAQKTAATAAAEAQSSFNQAMANQMAEMQDSFLQRTRDQIINQVEELKAKGIPPDQAVAMVSAQQQTLSAMAQMQAIQAQAAMARQAFLTREMANAQNSLNRGQSQTRMMATMDMADPSLAMSASTMDASFAIASALSAMPEEQRAPFLQSLSQSDPMMFRKVDEQLRSSGSARPTSNTLVGSPATTEPLPEQRPPRRDGMQ